MKTWEEQFDELKIELKSNTEQEINKDLKDWFDYCIKIEIKPQIKSFIKSQLTELAKEMIGEERKDDEDDDKHDRACNRWYNAKRDELIKTANKWQLDI